MKCIVNGKIVMPDGLIEGRALVFGEKIAAITEEPPAGAERIDAGGGYVAPGLIDVHCHGFSGWDASRGDVGELQSMCAALPQHGVTAWMPTIMTLPWNQMEACFEAVRRAMAGPLCGAQILGCHSEGPFISHAHKGAQDGNAILPPDIERLRPWADVVRLMTVAPEREGALGFIRSARALGVRLSMGHTDATAEAALAGFAAGIDHVTHLFNAMSPLNHRAPGAVGAALAEESVYCEMIADTLHISPLLFPMLYRLKPDRLVLITDSIQVAGLPDGVYDQLGRTVVVEGAHCHFPDGTIAGSALTLDAAVRNFARFAHIDLWQAMNMAALHPARSIGVDDRKGALLPGLDADLIVADGGFHICQTYVGGRCVYVK